MPAGLEGQADPDRGRQTVRRPWADDETRNLRRLTVDHHFRLRAASDGGPGGRRRRAGARGRAAAPGWHERAGESGTGKSHILGAIALRAYLAGRVIRFADLLAGLADGSYEARLCRWARHEFVVLDDVGLG